MRIYRRQRWKLLQKRLTRARARERQRQKEEGEEAEEKKKKEKSVFFQIFTRERPVGFVPNQGRSYVRKRQNG